MSTVQFVDPRATPAAVADVYDLTTALGDGAVIGLMANGFPDSDTFLHHIELALGSRLDGVTFHHWNKGNASRLANDEEVQALASKCDAVIGAYGH